MRRQYNLGVAVPQLLFLFSSVFISYHFYLPKRLISYPSAFRPVEKIRPHPPPPSLFPLYSPQPLLAPNAAVNCTRNDSGSVWFRAFSPRTNWIDRKPSQFIFSFSDLRLIEIHVGPYSPPASQIVISLPASTLLLCAISPPASRGYHNLYSDVIPTLGKIGYSRYQLFT